MSSTYRGSTVLIILIAIAIFLAQASFTFAQVLPLELTTASDSFLRNGQDDRNEGANPHLFIQQSGKNRTLVAFDQTAISNYVAEHGITSATLVLTIAENGDNWGNSGRTVDAHPLLTTFAEGNGKDAGLPGSESTRGTGLGVTWNCATDTAIENQSANCSPQWNGGTYGSATAPSVTHTNGQAGEISWDVTTDVLNGSFSWLVKKTNENQAGKTEYYSREGATVAGNPTFAPRLVLTPPPTATITVIKNIVNDNFGTSTASNFSFQVSGGASTPFEADGINEIMVSPGTYSITETTAFGYTTTYNNCTNLVLSAGATATCTVTNNDIPGALLTVRKVVEGGSAVPSDFTLFVGSTSVQSGQQNLFSTGDYLITESGPVGYRAEFSGDCDASGNVTLGLNQIKDCVITNFAVENTLALCTDGIDNDFDGTADLYDSECDAFIPRITFVPNYQNSFGGTAGAGGPYLTLTLHIPSGGVPGTTQPINGQFLLSNFINPITLKLNPGSYSMPYALLSNPYGYGVSASVDCGGVAVAGDNRICTVTVHDIAPVPTVVKHVVNSNGGSAVAGDFAMNVSGTNVSNPFFAGDESGVTLTLNAGAYTVTDIGPSGYIESSSPHCSGTMNVGDVRICTITSADIPLVEDTLAFCTDATDNDQNGLTDLYDPACEPFIPRVTFVPNYVNNHGGVAGVGGPYLTLTLHIPTGGIPSTAQPINVQLYLSNFINPVTLKLNPGSYSMPYALLSNPYGYNVSRSVDCDGVVVAGDNKTCTVTVQDVVPSLLVIKHVVNTNGGTATAADFAVNVSGANVSNPSFSGSENGTVVTLDAGAYTVTETGPSGYVVILSTDCSGTMSVGDVKTCTITSSDVPLVENTLNLCTDGIDNNQNGLVDLYDSTCEPYIPRLTVVFDYVSDNGGTRTSGGQIHMNISTGSLPGTVNGVLGSLYLYGNTTLKLNLGSYNTDYIFAPSGYAGSGSLTCSGTLVAGDTKTCTVIFNDIAPVLNVIKHVNNNNGGTTIAGDFTINIAGTDVSNPSFVGDESGTIVGLDAGTYSVTETGPLGYTELVGTNCAGSIGLGETRTCTLTSDDIPPALILIKEVINDNGGTATTTDWALSAIGPTPISGPGFVTSETTNGFMAGTYTLSESNGPPGYTASAWSCVGDVTNVGNSITMDIGQNATCTITNNDSP